MSKLPATRGFLLSSGMLQMFISGGATYGMMKSGMFTEFPACGLYMMPILLGLNGQLDYCSGSLAP